MSQGTATSTFSVGIKYDTKTLSQLESQLERIAELLDRINGRRYDAGMKLSADVSVKTGMITDGFKVFGPVQTAEIINDDHIRQIVREEIRQFVNRESRCGGLFSK
ncbi:hypothetical protein M5U04_17535 [Xenorhabdus sp. XENO-1]|uniref:hypothetical protein n=1 Tax=Xenorhabdus bovienii TaxID=40576 RepID=UPI0020CA9377|nr:hypothetical protein [Xenorhabdus bovienii]MCP9269831.1 hypothetical protein [Xenorhabdus bovienii subsp. africana]